MYKRFVFEYCCSRYVGGTDFTPTAAGKNTIELERADQIDVQAGEYNMLYSIYLFCRYFLKFKKRKV